MITFKNIFFVIFLLHNTLSFSQSFKYVKNAGGKSNDVSNAVCVDGTGLYITGSFKGTATFDSAIISSKGEEDVFIARYSDSCKLKWIIQFGGTGEDVATAISSDGDGSIYIAGYFNGSISWENQTLKSNGTDAFIVKYDSAGIFKWARQAGGKGNDYAYSLKTDGRDKVYMTGDFTGPANFDAIQLTGLGMKDIFIASYDTAGTLNWAQQAGGSNNDAGNGICLDKKGNILVTGSFTDAASYGTTQVHSTGGTDIFIASYSNSGNSNWVATAGGKGNDAGNAVVVDDTSGIYVTGNFRDICSFGDTSVTSFGGTDVFLARYTVGGKPTWVRAAGGNENDESNAIVVDKGNPYITGSFKNILHYEKGDLYSDEGTDVFIIKYTAAGKVDWSRKAGGLSNDLAQGIDIDRYGNIYVTGVFKELARFGNHRLLNTSAGGTSDIFLTKIEPPVPCKCDKRKNIIKWQPLGALISYSRFAYERAINDRTSFLIEFGRLRNDYDFIKDDTIVVSGKLTTFNRNIFIEYRRYTKQALKGAFYGPFARVKWGENYFTSFGERGLDLETVHYNEKSISGGLGFLIGYQHIFRNCITLEAYAGGYVRLGTTYDREYFTTYDSDQSIREDFPTYQPFQLENTGISARVGIKLGYAFNFPKFQHENNKSK